MAVQIGGINARITKDWLPFQVLYADNGDRQAGAVLSNAVADGPARGASAAPYKGGVVLPDGKVVLVPSSNPTIGIFDPVAGTIADGPAHGTGLTRAYAGGVMMATGMILLIPDWAPDFIVYDPAANVIAARIPHGIAQLPYSMGHFYGAVVARDGMVYAFHTTVRQMMRVNPAGNTLTTVGAVAPTDASASSLPFITSALLRDGRIFLLPRANTWPLAFNPETLAWTELPAASGITGTQKFNGATLGPDGRVYCVRGSSTNVPRIYDPVANDWPFLPALTGATGSPPFVSAITLRMGKVAFLPVRAQHPAIYDIASNSLSLGGQVSADALANYFNGGVQLNDGRVLLLADAAAHHKLWTPYTGGTPLPYDFIASRYIGNRG